MTILTLGVIDIPYAYEQQQLTKKGKAKKRGKTVTKSITTGEVADILEARYHPMEVFAELHLDDIVGVIMDSYQGASENVLLGGPVGDPAAQGMEKIEEMFRDFLTNQEMDKMGVPGVPTQAAQAGVSHRFAHPYAKRAERPSFIDTGLYQANFKAWMVEF